MLKFLRKRAKTLMVIFGTLLMIAFLAPQGIQQIGQQQLSQIRYVIGSGDEASRFSRADVIKASSFRRAGQIVFERIVGERRFIPYAGDDIEHWLLLVHAADQAGLIGGPADGEYWYNTFWRQVFRNQFRTLAQFDPDFADLSPEEIEQRIDNGLNAVRNQAQGETRLNDRDFFQALAQAQGIERLYQLYLGSARPSIPAVQQRAQEIGEEILVDAVVLPGQFAALPGDPPEETLQRFFEERRSRTPVDSPDGIGYLLPPRVQLEWLEINRQKIREQIEAESGARLRFEAQRDFADGWEPVYGRSIDERVEQMLTNAIRAARATTNRATSELTQVDGVFVVTPGWTAPTMADLADAIESIGVPRPAIGATDRLETLAQFRRRESEAINRLTFQSDGLTPEERERIELFTRFGASRPAPIPFNPDTMTALPPRVSPELAFRVREITSVGGFSIQVGIPATDYVLRDQWDPETGRGLGNAYIMRVVDASTEVPADSIEQVRDTIAEDFKRLQGYQVLLTEIPSMAGTLASEGIFGVRQEFRSRMPEGATPPLVGQNLRVTSRELKTPPAPPTGAGPSLQSRDFLDAVVERATRYNRVERIVDQPEINPFLIVPVLRHQTVVVAEIKFIRPITVEGLFTAGPTAVNDLFRAESEALPTPQEVYSKQALIKRYGLEDRIPADENEDIGTAGN